MEGNSPVSYHMNTLLVKDRYGTDLDEGDLSAADSTIDELGFALDGNEAIVVDDRGDRSGEYDNAAAFITRELGNNPVRVNKILSADEIHGFVTTHADYEDANVIGDGAVQLAQIPAERAFIFNVADQDLYDIKIE
jgi:hypothetical protein